MHISKGFYSLFPFWRSLSNLEVKAPGTWNRIRMTDDQVFPFTMSLTSHLTSQPVDDGIISYILLCMPSCSVQGLRNSEIKTVCVIAPASAASANVSLPGGKQQPTTEITSCKMVWVNVKYARPRRGCSWGSLSNYRNVSTEVEPLLGNSFASGPHQWCPPRETYTSSSTRGSQSSLFVALVSVVHQDVRVRITTLFFQLYSLILSNIRLLT